MKKTIKDFKAFAVKGNVVDLALAVIIGGAFGKIVTSLVNDLVMPFFGYLLGGVKFNNLKYVLKEVSESNKVEISINYGAFIQTVVDFLIISIFIFMVIKIFTKLKRKEEEEKEKKEEEKEKKEEKKVNQQELLLTEIRDILKEKNK